MKLNIYISFFLCVCIVNLCFGQNNLIDSSFGENGKVRPRFDRKPIYNSPELDKKNRLMLQRDSLMNGNDYATVIYRYTTSGQPDLTFNGSGRMIVNVNMASDSVGYSWEYVQNLHFLNDNRIQIDVYNEGSVWWLRFNENGTPDNQFGTNGKMKAPLGYDGYTTQITTDNKMLTASSSDINIINISKFNTNGSPDNSFGTAGVRTNNFGDLGTEMEYVDDLQIDAGGNIFVIGESSLDTLVIVKLNPNGTVLANYGTNGYLEYYRETEDNEILDFYDFQLAADGKLMAFGEDDKSTTAVIRFTTNGTPDNNFGTGGLLLLPYLGGNMAFSSFTPSSGSAIWLCGIAKEQNYYRYLVSKRLNNGSVDNSFGNNGYISLNINNQDAYGYGLKEIAGGKILMVGSAYQDNYYGTTAVQLMPNGQLDNSFANNGKLHILGVDPNRTNDYDPTTTLSDLVAGPDNTVLFTGFYEEGSFNNGSFFVSSLSENGTVISSFGNKGIATISSLYGNEASAGKIVRQPDGKIVVAHIVSDIFTDGTSILLQRLTATGQPDPGFGTLGRTLIPFGPDEYIDIIDLKASPNGKLGLILEYYDEITDDENTPFYQFTANGIQDNTFSGDGKFIPAFDGTHLVYNNQNKLVLLGERYFDINDSFVDMVVQRFNESGTADNSFNSGNLRSIQLSVQDSPEALILEEGDNLTILFQPDLANKDYGIAKLGSNGLPLPAWGVNGIVAGTSGTGDTHQWMGGIRLDNGGYLFANDNNESDLQLLKITPSGGVDSSFANNGNGLIDFGIEGSFDLMGGVLLPGGKLIVGGNEFNNINYTNTNEILITQINISAPSKVVYTLTNPGNWSNPANWQTGQIPPSIITPGMEIIINPGGNGIATLDINIIVQLGGKITVMPGKRLNVNAMLTVPSIQ